MLLVFQNKTNIEIIGFRLMHFRFALDLPDIGLWNMDLCLDLLDTEFPRKHFVCLQDIFKTSSRCLQRNNFYAVRNLLRRRLVKEVFKTCLEDVFKTPWRRTNVCWEGNVSNWKTSKLIFRTRGFSQGHFSRHPRKDSLLLFPDWAKWPSVNLVYQEIANCQLD